MLTGRNRKQNGCVLRQMVQRVEKVRAARIRTIPGTAQSLRQGGAALARPSRDPFSAPLTEFFNTLGNLSKVTGAEWCGRLLDHLGGLEQHVLGDGEPQRAGRF